MAKADRFAGLGSVAGGIAARRKAIEEGKPEMAAQAYKDGAKTAEEKPKKEKAKKKGKEKKTYKKDFDEAAKKSDTKTNKESERLKKALYREEKMPTHEELAAKRKAKAKK
jgi:hypothetical protein